MELMHKQAYHLWFNWIGNKIIEWRDAKPTNPDLKNCVKALNEIGTFTNSLQTEVEVLHKRISLIRSQKNEMIVNLQDRVKELEDELKSYKL